MANESKLKPFIVIYNFLFYIIKIPFKIIKYISIGFFFSLWFSISTVVNGITKLGKPCIICCKQVYRLLHYVLTGFIIICKKVYNKMKYVFKGLQILSYLVFKAEKYIFFAAILPFVYITRALISLKNAYYAHSEERKRATALKIKKQTEERIRKIKERQTEERIKTEKKQAIKAKTERYINKELFKKRTVDEQVDAFFKNLSELPKKIGVFFKNQLSGNENKKFQKAQKKIDRQVLLIDFDSDDAIKSDKKLTFQYDAIDENGKHIIGYFDAFSKIEVHSFLLSENCQVYSIKTSQWIQLIHGKSGTNHKKFKIKDLIFFLTQLSTYIKAGITLVEALKILSRQYKDKTYKQIFKGVIYDLTMGNNFSESLSRQGEVFPKLLINMVKTSEMTGELPETLDDMASYYEEVDKTKKQMITALTYPAIIFVLAIGVTSFMMLFVIPKFVAIYETMQNTNIPGFTLAILAISNFLRKYIIWLFLGITIFIVIITYLYRNVKAVKAMFQWGAMHFPVFGNVIIFNEVTMFTKTFASLLKHNVFITDSMEILNKITNNEIYKLIILDTITNLARGERISLSFKDHWAFPIPAYEMLVTGEKTGQLPEMMGKVSVYYQELHKNSVGRIKTFIEPILIIFLTGVVGTIVLALVIPMFNMYKAIGG